MKKYFVGLIMCAMICGLLMQGNQVNANGFGPGQNNAAQGLNDEGYTQEGSGYYWTYGNRNALFYAYTYSNYFNANYSHVSFAFLGDLSKYSGRVASGQTAYAQTPNGSTSALGTAMIGTF